MKIALTVLFLLLPTLSFADGRYCPEAGMYGIEVVGDELWITHLNHPAYCVRSEGITFQCVEKYPNGDVSKYTVKAVEFNPGLAFLIEGEDAPWGVRACE